MKDNTTYKYTVQYKYMNIVTFLYKYFNTDSYCLYIMQLLTDEDE